MKRIDLRSDTVTLPSDTIRDSIYKANLGDDVFKEDPTVNSLEKKAAQLSGKADALLVPSGTMGNLISFLVHCERGTEAILGDKSHTFINEAGGISAFGGIHSHQIKNEYDAAIYFPSNPHLFCIALGGFFRQLFQICIPCVRIGLLKVVT